MGRPIILLLSEGQMSDHRGAAMLLPVLPATRELLADRGYDSNHFRAALAEQASAPASLNQKPRRRATLR
jgi:transposase